MRADGRKQLQLFLSFKAQTTAFFLSFKARQRPADSVQCAATCRAVCVNKSKGSAVKCAGVSEHVTASSVARAAIER